MIAAAAAEPDAKPEDVQAKVHQGTLDFAADKMHVLLTQSGKPSAKGESRLGIERLDAIGNVLVQDPNSNLKFSRCETLSATMQDDNKLATAIIGISSIHLLKTFINAAAYEEKTLFYQTVIHVAFLFSALAIAAVDRIMPATVRHAGVPPHTDRFPGSPK
jgi:hypothetical protein